VLSGPGRLSDVAPTVLAYLEIEPSAEMTGRCLVSGREAPAGRS
jgi:bisphosphoglycerate-independent phosphoglycerate mutase (AlkP superfamily)